MIKRAPSPLAMAGILVFALGCFSILLYLWLAFGGPSPMKPKGYRFQVAFPEATQLASQAEIRISGVTVGNVQKVEPSPTGNRTEATLQLDAEYAPIPKNTRAVLRLKSLLGETFVELSTGDRTKGLLHDGGRLPDGAVEPTVQLDEIMSTFDAPTQEAFRTWMQSQAIASAGRGADINAALGNLPGFAESADHLLTDLDRQSAAVRQIIDSTGDFFSSLSARKGELSGLITDSNQVFQVVGARNEQLAELFRVLPRFERASRATLPRLTAFGDEALPVIRQLQPAADEMTGAFANLEALSPDFRRFFERLDPVVDASEKGLPAFETILEEMPGLLEDFGPFLRNANPMVSYIDANKRDVLGFFANAVAATLGRDLNLPRTDEAVHYLRTSQTLSPQALTFYPRKTGASRTNPYPAPGARDKLATGYDVFDSRSCANGNPAPPTAADPPELVELIRLYAFRTDSRDIATPACVRQGRQSGFLTDYPQLRAQP